ncbi:putative transcriptional regulatory protein [Lachnellula subtilissima]|uniref:Putative transcriptional regulatory protein n=1 Tax=Lachnellula subtilissima TaxID=602034 RepID=A0A8H8RJX3_9HELO|nr:putative transcriptional regulatory protein [Lachnellula subtilissima]
MSQRRSREENDLSPDDGAPAGKLRRISRACNQCRNRKQKCDGQSHTEPLQPCQRCCQLGFTCSFTTTPLENEVENSAIAIKKVGKIQKQLLDHQKRIEDLEENLRAFKNADRTPENGDVNVRDTNPANGGFINSGNVFDGSLPGLNGEANNQIFSPATTRGQELSNHVTNPSALGDSTSPSQLPAETPFTMDAVDLDTPMSTLRNIASLSKENVSASRSMTYDPIFPMIGRQERRASVFDPVTQGIFTMEEAQQSFDIFFEHCHPMAPFLCIQSQRSAALVREASPVLFLSVCAVGARFWQTANRRTNYQGLHENYRAIVALLDSSLSRLLLQPILSDVTLDHIRSLLLYIQWMPVEQETPGICQTRYNDISAWSVLGLAIRYSIFLGLDRSAVTPFSTPNSTGPGQEDFSRLRVWINVLTCDCHLMLSAGLPASVDPEPVTMIGRAFASHEKALQPDDSRVAAISELVAIIKRAAKSSGDPRLRVLDSASLKKANAEFDNWEAFWTSKLTRSSISQSRSSEKPTNDALDNCQHNQMPFTSLRSYRLAINSAGLGSMLSRKQQPHEPMQLSLLQALDASLLAAAQTIFALSNETNTQSWTRQSYSLTSFPVCPFTIDETALGRFRFSVDSSWITHSFAAVFLVLRTPNPPPPPPLFPQHNHCALNPRPPSLLYRLTSLASQIFDTICRTSATAHPAADYRSIIQNVFALILGNAGTGAPQINGSGGPPEQVYAEALPDQMGVDALFELMFSDSAGFNWQSTGLFREDGGMAGY